MRTSTTVNQKSSTLLSKMLPLVVHRECGGRASRREEGEASRENEYLKYHPSLVLHQSLWILDWLLFSKSTGYVEIHSPPMITLTPLRSPVVSTAVGLWLYRAVYCGPRPASRNTKSKEGRQKASNLALEHFPAGQRLASMLFASLFLLILYMQRTLIKPVCPCGDVSDAETDLTSAGRHLHTRYTCRAFLHYGF